MTTDRSRPVRDIQAAPSSASGMSTKQMGPAWLKIVLTIVAVVVLLISGAGYVLVGKLGNEVASASNLALGDRHNREDTADGATDILLVGSDSRTDARGNPLPEEDLAKLNAGEVGDMENTDTMIIVRVPNDGAEATAVSIPRDTYIHDDEFGNMKINSVYATYKADRRDELIAEETEEGEDEDSLSDSESRRITESATEAGRQGLISALSDLTGVEIDHYAEVGLHGFVSLTNAVGGVEVCLKNPVKDELSGADFPAGEQTLNGYEALAFVRQRHGLPRGDLDRIVRQQAYMASLVNKVLSADVLTNPSKLSNMADAVENSVVIDEDWDVMSFATQMANLAAGNVTFTTIPVTSIDGTGDYGESIITVNVDEVHNFMDSLVAPPPEETKTPASQAPASEGESAPAPNAALEGMTVLVLNAGSETGLANSIGAWLNEQGVSVGNVSNAQPGIYYSSQVVAADPDSEEAQALSEMLGGLPITGNSNLDAGTLVIAAADDYTGPASDVPADASTTAPDEPVGTPGADFGRAEDNPDFNAGGTGPRCVN